MNKKVTSTIIKKFKDSNGKVLTIVAEISDTKRGLFFRLRSNPIVGLWSNYYGGIYVLEVNNRLFGFASGYWAGVLPIEEPFEIVKGK
jgi:hypothetical protein